MPRGERRLHSTSSPLLKVGLFGTSHRDTQDSNTGTIRPSTEPYGWDSKSQATCSKYPTEWGWGWLGTVFWKCTVQIAWQTIIKHDGGFKIIVIHGTEVHLFSRSKSQVGKVTTTGIYGGISAAAILAPLSPPLHVSNNEAAIKWQRGY